MPLSSRLASLSGIIALVALQPVASQNNQQPGSNSQKSYIVTRS